MSASSAANPAKREPSHDVPEEKLIEKDWQATYIAPARHEVAQ
jgi:hypothetical protein